MVRLKKVLRNIIILAILFFLFLTRSGLYFSSMSAHEHSERSIHYGPSKVVHVEDFDKGKYILGKYDKWVSCNTMNRVMFFFWRFGNQPVGFENDKTQSVSYSWGSSDQYNKLYGIVNDSRITKVEITLNNGDTLTKTDFYEDLFLLTWESDGGNLNYFKNIRGYDSENNILFEEKH
jgi:hypothetical protein